MLKHTSHRQLKNRTLKRRVNSHQFNPDGATFGQNSSKNDYENQRANRDALNKLRRKPALIELVSVNLEKKQQSDPQQPQLLTWQDLIDPILEDSAQSQQKLIEKLEKTIMDCGQEAKLLREYSALDCLFDE